MEENEEKCISARPFADTTLIHVPKPRSGSKYSGVLRSPQELEIIEGPN